MLLKDWLKQNNVKPYKLSQELHIHDSTIYRILNGERRASTMVASKICNYTKGVVSKAEVLWPEDYEEKKSDGAVQLKMDI